MHSVVRLAAEDAGELLTLQRAAYVTEAQAHGDVLLPSLTQSSAEVAEELSSPGVTAIGIRTETPRLVAAVRVSESPDDPHAVDVGRLVVAPDMQGRGLGTRLLGLVEGGLPATISRLVLFTGEHSTGNLRLYRRLGYRDTHRQETPGGYALIHLSKNLA
ncbi:GNAT family N-acetyltransferase [Rhodococcus fascians]|nr:GNAT family N-acetyltransferase [Rhodococcus fascians]MBY4021313.1 GNAT family N-acetyltransferase [Rhodococcus fascians]